MDSYLEQQLLLNIPGYFIHQLYLILHSTNVNPNERPRLFRMKETDDGFEIVERIG